MYQKYVYILLFKTCRNTNLNSPPPYERKLTICISSFFHPQNGMTILEGINLVIYS